MLARLVYVQGMRPLFHRPAPLHPAIRHELVDLLYSAWPQVVAIVAAGTFGALALALARLDFHYALAACLIGATGGLRLYCLMRYPRGGRLSPAGLAYWERLYALGAVLFCAALGLLSYLALARGDQPGAWVALGLSLANCIGLISRAAVRPWIVAVAAGSLFTPTMIGGLLRPELPYQIGASMLVLFWLTLCEASRHLSADFIRRIELERELAHQASHDPLTGLPNRLAFMTRLSAAAQTPDTAFAVLAIDLDSFKPINDTLGHHVGDEVLRQVGDRLTRSIGASGLAARTGGDEFMLLLMSDGPAIDVAAAEALAEQAIIRLSLPFALTTPVSIGASIGIAHGRSPVSRDEIRRMLVAADKALYEAKRAGGGVWRWAGNGRSARQAA